MSIVADPIALTNARFRTMDPSRPLAASVTLRRGRIATIDSSNSADAIDLGGATVLPGFIDSHLHLGLGGEALLQVDLSAAKCRTDFEATLAARGRTLQAGSWLIGTGWNEDAYPDRELPDSSWLATAGDHPAVCWRMDQHACVVNAPVLALIGANHDLSRDPSGGRIVRDAHGTPTGLLQEAAAWQLVKPIVPTPSIDELRRAVRAAQSHLAHLGLTAVGSMEYGNVVRDAIEPLRQELRVRMRVTLLDREWPNEFDRWLAFARQFSNDDRLAIFGMKAFVDGTLGSHTARMLGDYADEPGNRGLLVELAERGVLVDWIRRVFDAGLSPSMHAIGDDAARIALNALDAAEPRAGAPRGRIEHAQTVAPSDMPRFRGRFASMQPLHKAYDARSAESRLGAARMERFFPFRSLLAHGARLAFGSDWPIVSADPIAGIAAAVTGKDVDGRVVCGNENLEVHDAIVAYTSEAAACLGMRDAGVIRVGAFADLVVLDRDPYECDWNVERPQVVATFMGGRVTPNELTSPP